MKSQKHTFRRAAAKAVAQAAALLFFALSFFLRPAGIYAAKGETLRTVGKGEIVEHLFTHCLIAHPDVAFAPGNEYGRHLDEDCLTPGEFRKILSALREDGYALVDVRSTFRTEGDKAERIPFSFPADKKPLILSFDDVVYATANRGKGMADKLVLTDSGEIAAYTKNRNPQTHREEFLPILEDFIAEHPDFSFRGARGILFLTGFDGILGYRTQRDSPDRTAECERAKKVVSALRERGWVFGSHSYAHGHMNGYSEEKMRSDARKWKDEVEPLVGKTCLYAYPYGEWTLGENCSDKRQQCLINAGFRVFFGVGNKPFYTRMPLGGNGEKVLFQDRCAMDGISLRAHHLDRFFAPESVYETIRPIPFP